MEQLVAELQERKTSEPANGNLPAGGAPSGGHAAPVVSPQTCPSCGTAPVANGGTVVPLSCIYVIGHIEPRFPLLSIEREARQVTARAGASKDTDREVMAKLLRDPDNKYLVRQLCWVLSIQGVETYILVPGDGDYQPLIDAYRAEPNPGDLELVIGVRGPIAPPTMCNGLLVPIVIFYQIYAFDRDTLLEANSQTEGWRPEIYESCGRGVRPYHLPIR